jgi:hypothetical protein
MHSLKQVRIINTILGSCSSPIDTSNDDSKQKMFEYRQKILKYSKKPEKNKITT